MPLGHWDLSHSVYLGRHFCDKISQGFPSLVPRPPPFFVLRFVFSIIHGWTQTEEQKKNGKGLGTRLELFPCPYLYTVSGSKTLLSVGRPGTEVAMALSSLSLSSQIELHCTSPHVPSIALRDMNLTTVSSPTTIHPHIPIIAGATSSGRVLLWDWESSCRKAFENLLFLDIHFNHQKKNYHIRQSFRLVSCLWFSFLISLTNQFHGELFYVLFCSFLIMIELLKERHISVNCLEWILATPSQHLCCYSLRHSGF